MSFRATGRVRPHSLVARCVKGESAQVLEELKNVPSPCPVRELNIGKWINSQSPSHASTSQQGSGIRDSLSQLNCNSRVHSNTPQIHLPIAIQISRNVCKNGMKNVQHTKGPGCEAQRCVQAQEICINIL